MASDRTEKATPKRREDARKKGQMARGAKLPAAAGFLAALFVLGVTGNDWLQLANNSFISILSQSGSSAPLTEPSVHKIFINAIWSVSALVLPVMFAVLIATVAGNFLQDGFSLTASAFVPKLERFNPIANMKRIFSSKTLVEFFKSMIELGVICIVCYGLLTRVIADAPGLIGSTPSHTIAQIGSLAYALGIRVGGILLLFAVVDYGYKRYSHEKSLRMTKQEIKDEFRQQEGDPMVKGQRRRAARALVQRRLAVEVPRADVVVINPTHFAVALLYDIKKYPAPMVIAKGADLMAKRIIEIAKANNVAVVQNPPLARILFRDVEPGQSIPAEFFRAVAELLAYVYRQQQMHKK